MRIASYKDLTTNFWQSGSSIDDWDSNLSQEINDLKLCTSRRVRMRKRLGVTHTMKNILKDIENKYEASYDLVLEPINLTIKKVDNGSLNSGYYEVTKNDKTRLFVYLEDAKKFARSSQEKIIEKPYEWQFKFTEPYSSDTLWSYLI